MISDSICITMTATRRPELLKDTLSSFRDNMFKDRLKKIRLIVNVDPVGHDIPSLEVVNICRSFCDNVVYRCPGEPNFPKAFLWCWSQVTEDYIFNLEEDWRLLTRVDLSKMIALMKEIDSLAVLRLSFSPCKENVKNWGHFIDWNGSFYEVDADRKGLLGFSGNPSLVKIIFVRVALSILNGKSNPEKQLKWKPGDRRNPLSNFLQSLRYGVYGFPGMPTAVLDTGRRWKQDFGWRKVDDIGKENKAFFTKWEKCKI